MTISQVNASFAPATQSAGARFFLPGAKEFAGSLNLGQILKGKVLRQYDGGNRYLVNFEGHERVVDSAVPLRTGELLHGRVVALGDRVEMQRVYSDNDGAAVAGPADAGEAARGLGGSRYQVQLEAALDRYQTQLSESDRAVLLRTMRAASDAPAMAQIGVLLSKLGLSQSAPVLESVYARLKGDTNQVRAYSEWRAPAQLESSVGQVAGLQATTMRHLADVVSRALGDDGGSADDRPVEADASSAREKQGDADGKGVRGVGFEPDQDDSNRLAQWVLNAQPGGSVMHRLGTLPLILGGRLVEVDVAMFEQRRESAQEGKAQHRQLVFTLRTEHLGRVEVVARMVGERVRVSIATDNEDNTALAAQHASALKASLAEAGWVTDEVSYETRGVNAQTGAVSSVVEHVISLDSMNRLI